MTEDKDGTIVITGAANIEAASLLALRGSLRMEARTGMKRRGRSAQTIANERMGTKYRDKRRTYEAFDAWLTARYPGRVDPWPLDGPRPSAADREAARRANTLRLAAENAAKAKEAGE